MVLEPAITKYNKGLAKSDREICDVLALEISTSLKKAESKVWHGAPVWFLDGNPIVGYDKLKDAVQLLFWSGQSFKESGLHAEGSFKAAEARYVTVADVKKTKLRRWLKESAVVQWDYKNIRKNKGVLKRIAVPKKAESK